jgi:hypothetical protein
MDARAFAAATLMVATHLLVGPADAYAATVESANFVVTAPTEGFAQQVSKAAEYYRHELAIAWLGEKLPGNWSSKCPIKCKVGQIGAGGATTFTFNDGEVFGWRMEIQGTEERILDSVLPHEVSHMIFASHFRRPLPRWADEGAATLVEHESERLRQTKLLDQVIRTSKRIPLEQLLNIKEYPKDMQDVLTLYAEGYSLADYLVQQKGEQGKAIYLKFLDDAHRHGWDAAFQTHYDTSVAAVEEKWTGWVMAGSPPIEPADGTLVAMAEEPGPLDTPATRPVAATRQTPRPVEAPPRTIREESPALSPQTVVRGQSTGELEPLPSLNRSLSPANVGAELHAPRPAELSESSMGSQPQFYAGEHRMTAQPSQPTIVEPIDTSRRRRETLASVADPRTATDSSSREDSFGQPRPISFDAPTGTAGDMTSPAPIAASGNPQEAGATNGLGPDSTGRFALPGRRDEGRTPSPRGFTPGRGSPPASARGLFSP